MPGKTNWQPLLRSLEDPLRRRLLVDLLERGGQADELVIPGDVESEQDDGETSRIELEHVHLPLLETRGYIEWDREADLVTEGPNFDEVQPLLELIEANRDALPDGWR